MSVHIPPIAGSHGPVFLVNSRLGHFSAAMGPPPWPYFSRSYVCILPSSLTRVLPYASAFSACLPVSGPPQHILRGSFPARRLHALHPPVRGLPHGSAQRRDLPLRLSASPLCRGLPTPRRASPYASPHRSCGRRGNVDPLPIAYGFRPRLRGRLTPGQIAFTLETSGFRRRGIPPLFALLMPAFSLPSRPPWLPPRLLPSMECSPTHTYTYVPELRCRA